MPKVLKIILIILILIVILIVISSFIGRMMFDRQVKQEVIQMFEMCEDSKSDVVTEADIADLPDPVQKWLRHSQIIGNEKVFAVRLKQEGVFRTKPGGNWMPFAATEYYTVAPPAFIWYTTMKAAPLFSITGRDMYADGKGNMLIKVLSLFTVADAIGPAMDQGTLIRFLNEIMWFPSAALSDYIQWKSIDANSAEATMSYRGVTASAVFYFSESGELTNMMADRYMDTGGKFLLEKWATPIAEYGEFHGIRIPQKGEGVWQLEPGDFSYVRITVTEIDYNNPNIYE